MTLFLHYSVDEVHCLVDVLLFGVKVVRCMVEAAVDPWRAVVASSSAADDAMFRSRFPPVRR